MVVERQHIVEAVSPATTVCRNVSAKRVRATPSLNIYRPPAARRSEPLQETQRDPSPEIPPAVNVEKIRASKQRRPDIQVYVPRAKRASAGEQELRPAVRQRAAPARTLRRSLPAVTTSRQHLSLAETTPQHRLPLAETASTSQHRLPVAETTPQHCLPHTETTARTQHRVPFTETTPQQRLLPTETSPLLHQNYIEVSALPHQYTSCLPLQNTIYRQSNNTSSQRTEGTLTLPSKETENTAFSTSFLRHPSNNFSLTREASAKQQEEKNIVVGEGVKHLQLNSNDNLTSVSEKPQRSQQFVVSRTERFRVKEEEKMIPVDEGVLHLPFNSEESLIGNRSVETNLPVVSRGCEENCVSKCLVFASNCGPKLAMDSCVMELDAAWLSSLENTPGQSGTSSPAPTVESSDCAEILSVDRVLCDKSNMSIIQKGSCSSLELKSESCKDVMHMMVDEYGDSVRPIAKDVLDDVTNNEQIRGEKSVSDIADLEIVSSGSVRECKKDIEDDLRKSEEQNRKNRRIIHGSIMSDVLIISDSKDVPTITDLPVVTAKNSPERSCKSEKKVKVSRKREGESVPEVKKLASVDLNPDESTWDMMFDDNGECLDPKLMEELTSAVGSVVIEKPQSDYSRYHSRHELLLPATGDEFSHVLEIYNFPPEFKTQDLLTIFSPYKNGGFEIKWVDDTHALGVFSSSLIAAEVLSVEHPFVKTRSLREATHESRIKARRSAEFLQPYRARPETCPALARRLVTGALGVRLPTSREEREAERKLLKEAREKKKMAARQRDDAWEGTIGGK